MAVLVVSGQAPAPTSPGENPLGAPVMVTLPVTVPTGVHTLDAAAASAPPEHGTDVASRLARGPKPRPEATCGRTVTNNTKLAPPITASRIHCFQRFMPDPHFRLATPVSDVLANLLHSDFARLPSRARPGTDPWE